MANGHDLQGLLKDPLVLNFAAALFALERVYQLFIECEVGLWGHFLVLAAFSLGFVYVLPFRMKKAQEPAWYADGISYGIFGLASAGLVVAVAADICIFGRWGDLPSFLKFLQACKVSVVPACR